MAIVRTQYAKNDNGTSASSFTIGSGQGWASTSSGSTVIVVMFVFNDTLAPATTGVTDNLSSTYTPDLALIGSYGGIYVYRLSNCPSGITTVNINWVGGGHASSAMALEYTGLQLGSPLDAVISALHNDLSATSWTSNNIATTGNDLLLGASMTFNHYTGTMAASGNWTGIANVGDSADGDDAFVEEQLNKVSGTYSASGTGTSANYTSAIISYLGVGLITGWQVFIG